MVHKTDCTDMQMLKTGIVMSLNTAALARTVAIVADHEVMIRAAMQTMESAMSHSIAARGQTLLIVVTAGTSGTINQKCLSAGTSGRIMWQRHLIILPML